MRIIPEDAKEYPYNDNESKDRVSVYLKTGTIEITDAEWDEIGLDYRSYSRKLSETYKSFSQYLKELISIYPLKELTIEQIKVLNK